MSYAPTPILVFFACVAACAAGQTNGTKVKKCPYAEGVSLCDRKPERAKQRAEQFSIANHSMPDLAVYLFVHVPEGMSLVNVRADAHRSGSVPVHWDRQGRLLSVTFENQQQPVSWEIRFGK